jgi:hypothetical protein
MTKINFGPLDTNELNGTSDPTAQLVEDNCLSPLNGYRCRRSILAPPGAT